MKRSTSRILTNHVGSLPRFARVTDLIFTRGCGDAVGEARFEAVLDEAVRDVVARQLAAGAGIISVPKASPSPADGCGGE